MPIQYLQIRALVDDAEFQKRLQVALWRKATLIVREQSPDPTQLAWARATLKGAGYRVPEATIRVATVGAVFQNGAGVSDDELQTVVSGIVADLAASL